MGSPKKSYWIWVRRVVRIRTGEIRLAVDEKGNRPRVGQELDRT